MLLFGWFPLALFIQIFRFLYQSIEDCTECTNYNWHHGHLDSPNVFVLKPGQGIYLSFSFHSISLARTLKPTIRLVLFFRWLLPSLVVRLRLGDYYYYHYTLQFFFIPVLVNGLSLKSEWQQVSPIFRILLSILANLINAVGWMVSIRSAPLYLAFWDRSELTNNNNYHCYLHAP